MAVIGLLCFEMCLQCLHGLFFFAVIIDPDKRQSLSERRQWLVRNTATQFELICDNMCNHKCDFCQFHSRALFHLVALHYECVGNSACIDFMKKWFSSANETMVQQDTRGNWCAPQHLPGSHQPRVSLTDRQLCKRE